MIAAPVWRQCVHGQPSDCLKGHRCRTHLVKNAEADRPAGICATEQRPRSVDSQLTPRKVLNIRGDRAQQTHEFSKYKIPEGIRAVVPSMLELCAHHCHSRQEGNACTTSVH